MKRSSIYEFVLAAMFAALAFAATNIVHIPVPATNGYIHLGDCVVLLGAFLLGPLYGAAAGGIGSAMADILSGYALYAPGTFIIKVAVAVVAGLLIHILSRRTKAAPVFAGICGELIMIFGYFVYESLVLRYGLAAAGSIVGNAVQAAAGVVFSALLYTALVRVPMIKKMTS